MRAYLDSILAFINSESLVDSEYETIDSGLEPFYSIEVYQTLKTILEVRESVSSQLEKLKSFFVLKGLDLDSIPANSPTSNLFIGARL